LANLADSCSKSPARKMPAERAACRAHCGGYSSAIRQTGNGGGYSVCDREGWKG